jgi:hypothetical protein
MSAADRTALQTRLSRLSGEALQKELTFLKSHVFSSPNADRAVRTYLELKTLQDTRPDRISQATVETLTRGVAEARNGKGAAGQEGILGPAHARDAAQALIRMPEQDFKALQKALDNAGMRDKKSVAKADPQAERALILKAVAARKDELANPSVMDRVRGTLGKPSSTMAEITRYAGQIAGTERAKLIEQSTVIDLKAGSGALQQRWQDSCTITAQQIARAEADPIYARQLHNEPIHSGDSNTAIGREQKQILEANGGTAVERGQAGGGGMWPEATLNDFVGKYSNQTYTRTNLADTKEARQGALNRADKLLRDGVDVPIVVGWDGGGSHSMLLTDVRGEGANKQYLLTDPYNGQTAWIRGSDIANGSTDFLCGTGKLIISYE